MLGDVEDEINEVLLRDLEVRWFVTDQAEAKRIGAIAMFGEKYGDQVRVVEIGDYSRELCGGTHVPRSSVIGMVKLLGEASIGAGVRRVEALVGLDAFRYLAREHVLVHQLAGEFKAQPEELPDRIAGVLDRLKAAERELDKLRAAQVLASAGALAAAAERVAGVQLVAAEAPGGVAGNDCGRSPRTCVAGCRPASRRWCCSLAERRRRRRVRRGGQRRRPACAACPPATIVRVFAPVLGARRRRQARPGAGRGRRRRQAGGRARRGPRTRRPALSARPMPDGVWLGVDVGTVRVGVARSDPRGVLAMPVRHPAPRRPGRHRHRASSPPSSPSRRRRAGRGVVVGLPRTLRGSEGPSAAMARDYAARLAPR